MERNQLENWASAESLELLGVVSLGYEQDVPRFRQWLAEGKQAKMAYMEAHQSIREAPERLLKGAKSAVILGLPYDHGDSLAREKTPKVAQYARMRDYHKVLRKKAERIAFQMDTNRENWRVVVDSAPLLERALARQTKLGFVGKNTCYIHPTLGSFLLLGEILTTRILPYDISEPSEGCGTCVRCQRYCPTGALDDAYRLDANKCLAYWTIENRDVIPREYWPWMGVYLFGCDICQLVCPFNREDGEMKGKQSVLKTREVPDLFTIATMNQTAYEKWFGGTPMTRAKRNGLRRNALVSMAVTKDPMLQEAMENCLSDCESPIGETLDQIEAFLAESRFAPKNVFSSSAQSDSHTPPATEENR